MADVWGRIGVPGRATALAALLMLVGALAVFVPYLTRKRALSGGVPAPPALYVATEYALAPGASACMSSVALEPDSRVAHFAARPAKAPAAGGASFVTVKRHKSHAPRPPVEITIKAPGYSASGVSRAGHGYKQLTVAIDPPKHTSIGTVCFRNVGRSGVALEGSSETRTVSRSALTLAGVPVIGDVALAFTQQPRRSLLSGLDGIFGHASALTGGLVPVWLIWLLAVLTFFGLPIGTLAAIHAALREDLSDCAAAQGC